MEDAKSAARIENATRQEKRGRYVKHEFLDGCCLDLLGEDGVTFYQLNVKFTWNYKFCWGTEFHVAVLTSDIEWAEKLLEEDTNHTNRRFRYHTVDRYNGAQEGSGAPIHLAVN